MQLGRVQFWRLDALPLDHFLLLCKIVPDNPLELLKWNVQQVGDDTHRDDGLRIWGRFFGAIPEEQNLSEYEVSLMVGNSLHLFLILFIGLGAIIEKFELKGSQ